MFLTLGSTRTAKLVRRLKWFIRVGEDINKLWLAVSASAEVYPSPPLSISEVPLAKVGLAYELLFKTR